MRKIKAICQIINKINGLSNNCEFDYMLRQEVDDKGWIPYGLFGRWRHEDYPGHSLTIGNGKVNHYEDVGGKPKFVRSYSNGQEAHCAAAGELDG